MIAISPIRAENCTDNIDRFVIVGVKGNSPFKGGYDDHTLRQACKHSVRYGHATTNSGAAKSLTLNQSTKYCPCWDPGQ